MIQQMILVPQCDEEELAKLRRRIDVVSEELWNAPLEDIPGLRQLMCVLVEQKDKMTSRYIVRQITAGGEF